MKGFKVIISEHSEKGFTVDHGAFFTDVDSMLNYVFDNMPDGQFHVSILPVELKVNYGWPDKFLDS